MDREKDYFIGLDIGSDSVGWAATDDEFNILRLKGKDAWGARIFDDASDAKERRMRRANKRRINRRKYRIFLLNKLFSSLINPIDDTFFLRLSESTYLLEDRSIKNPYLFLDKGKEKEYYKKFPTIWHLRKALIGNDQYALSDIRFVYLAIHHIIKYRGNFLKEGTIDVNSFDESIFEELNYFFRNLVAEYENCDLDNVDFDLISISQDKEEIIKIFEDKNRNKNDKKKTLKTILNKSINELVNQYKELFISVVVGGSYDLKKLDLGLDSSFSIKFDSSFDEHEAEYKSVLADKYRIIEIAKSIFDHFELKDLLQNEPNLSSAFVDVYERHKYELKALKMVCKDIDEKHNLTGDNSLYLKIFKKADAINYASFVGVNSNQPRTKDIHAFNAELLKALNPYLDEIPDSVIVKIDGKSAPIFIKQELANDNFLNIIANKSTGVIPHQLHLGELEIILNNASKKYPELENIRSKIIQLFKFRVPYYCGPLNDKSKYSSVVRNSNEIVTPWNFDEVINKSESKSKFINSLTNSCRYLLGSTNVLPKASIYYQMFVILDRLNAIQINGVLINKQIKETLLNDLILKNKKTTLSRIKTFLKKKYPIYQQDGVSISGINEKDDFINSTLPIFRQFFNKDVLTNDELKTTERIVYLLTIFKDDISGGISEIKKEYPTLTAHQINLLKSMSFNGWSSLSKDLLVNLKAYDDNGVVHSILSVMYDQILNFQQVLHSNEFKFDQLIANRNKEFTSNKTSEEVQLELIEEMPPKMRRSTIQALRIVDEITSIAGKDPAYIAIEVTREDNNAKTKKKMESISRYKELKAFLSSLVKDKNEIISTQAKEVSKELEDLAKEENNLVKLKGQHLYLYFKQCGFDMYTGEKINFEHIFDNTHYDIDHIIPQCLIKDDSLDNKVLVNKTSNEKDKAERYPLPETIKCEKTIRLWKYLHSKKAISDKKFNNLMRHEPISDEELNNFVNAQINVVNQSNVVLKEVLEKKFENSNTKLIFSKAQYPSYLRQELGIAKLRYLNDAHHGVDAYLNIVTGVSLYQRYTSKYYLKKYEQGDEKSYNFERFLKRQFVLNSDNKIKVIQNASKRDALITFRNIYQDSRFYKQTICKAGDGKLNPIHTKGVMADIDKYGGYNELANAYFVVANINGKKARRTLVSVPHQYDLTYGGEPELLKQKVIELVNHKPNETVEICLDKKIYNNQKILMNGCSYLMGSKGKVINLKPCSPIYLSSDLSLYLKKAEKYLDKLNSSEEIIQIGENRFGNNNQEDNLLFSKDKNISILQKLIELSKNKKYDPNPMIVQIRDFESEEYLTDFKAKTIAEEIKTIIDIIYLFTRNSRQSNIKKNIFGLSTTFIQDKPVVVIHDSITGLISYKEIL